MFVRSSQGHIVGSPPETRYIPVAQGDSRDRNPRSHATAYISSQGGTAVYPASRQARRPSEQTPEHIDQRTVLRNEHFSEADGLPSRLNRLCEDFLSVPMGQYSKLASFVINHAEIVSRIEIDNLIAEARTQKSLGKNAQKLVHHALILRRCKELDTKGRERFFKNLDNKNGDTLQAFVDDVKKVYATMSGPAESSGQQPQISHDRQNRNTPVVVQSRAQVSRHTPEYASQGQRQDAAPPSESDGPRKDLAFAGQAYSSDLRSQERRGLDKEGKLVYIDEFGRILRPVSSRQEPGRGQAEATDAEIARGMRSLSVGENSPRDERVLEARAVTFENPNRHVETSNHGNRRQSVSSGTAMPTLHEGMVSQGREFQGTGVEPETLDPRVYAPNPHRELF
jgi:Cdc37 Hsp90 binding domain